MSLCRPAKCGCTITSGSLSIEAKPGGVGYNIETYEGVATESPDTRPLLADRFEGMRVWTSDTKRLFVWDAAAGLWRILHEPPQSWTPTITQNAVSIPVSNSRSRYQRSLGVINAWANVVVQAPGAPGSGQIKASAPVDSAFANFDVLGAFYFYDASSADAIVGTTIWGDAVDEVRFITEATSGGTVVGASPALVLATGDQLSWHYIGQYVEA